MKMEITVCTQTLTIMFSGREYTCRIGRAGAVPFEQGREGDWKTPLGTYPVRYGFYRADRLPPPPSKLNFHPIRNDDGWCDDPNDPAYNQAVRLPYPASAEKMMRADGCYDIVIVLGHNDSPPVPGLGSAIFLHIAHIDDKETAGCVAVSPDVMTALLPKLTQESVITIR